VGKNALGEVLKKVILKNETEQKNKGELKSKKEAEAECHLRHYLILVWHLKIYNIYLLKFLNDDYFNLKKEYL
jgi:hypothetical protein